MNVTLLLSVYLQQLLRKVFALPFKATEDIAGKISERGEVETTIEIRSVTSEEWVMETASQ